MAWLREETAPGMEKLPVAEEERTAVVEATPSVTPEKKETKKR